MKKEKELYQGQEFLRVLLPVLLLLVAMLTLDPFSFVSHAEIQGKINVSSAKIRQLPTTKSEAIDGASANDTLVVTGQIQGTDDSYIWYQVLTNDQKTGYIRSDLMTVTGGTPPTLNSDGTPADTGTQTAGAYTEIEPVSATVTASSPARLRAEASSSATLLKTAESGSSLTVTGYQDDGEGNRWYKVKYQVNNEEIVGFVRSDYITLSGDIVSAGTTPTEPEPQPAEEPSSSDNSDNNTVTEKKDYDTMIGEDGTWMLVDNTTDPAKGYSIKEMFETNEEVYKKYNEAIESKKKIQKWITLLVIVIIALIAVIAIGFIKMKEMIDEADMLAAEKNVSRRNADRPQSGRMGTSRTGSSQSPAGRSGVQTGMRSAQGGRQTAGGEVRKAAPSQGMRSAQNPQTKSSGMPKAERPSQNFVQRQTKPVGNQAQSKSAGKLRNPMDDDDDIEFEFLNKKNWDEDEK